MKLTLSETPKTGFLVTRPIFKLIIFQNPRDPDMLALDELPNIKALILNTLDHIFAMKALRICHYVFKIVKDAFT